MPSHSEVARLLETESDEAFWTFDQVAALLHLETSRTVQRSLVAPGLLKAVRISAKKQRVRVRDLRAYLKQVEADKADEAATRVIEMSTRRRRSSKGRK